MEGLTNLLEKLSMEDIEKLKVLMSLSTEATSKEVVTLRMFSREYFDLIRQNRSAAYYTSVNNSFKHLFNFFHSQKSIKAIGLKETEKFITYLQGKVPKGYRVYVRTLKAAFNKAVKWGYVEENYFLGIKLQKKQQVNPAFINSEQLTAISNQIRNDTIRDIVIIGFYSGMRLNEIVNLKWKNVNISTKVITVGDEEFTTKGRNQRYIPISDEALEVLKRRSEIIGLENNEKENERSKEKEKDHSPIIFNLRKKENSSGYVFCKPSGTIYTGNFIPKEFKKACKSAAIDKDIHFHSLRHSFASSLVQKSVSLYAIKELLGHSSIKTTEIYSHLNIDSLRDAISVLDREEIFINKKPTAGLKLIINKG